MNEFTLTLNSPLTEEQWDIITDVDFEHTSEITFHTKHGKEVVFVKKSAQPEIIRCKDCKFYSPMNRETKTGICNLTMHQNFGDNWFCAGAERRKDEKNQNQTEHTWRHKNSNESPDIL